MKHGYPLRILLLAGMLFATSAGAAPGGLSISPVRVNLEAHQHAAAVTVTNTSAEPRLVQVEPTQWSQPSGSDEYAPTRELVANPPLFRLAPGGSQVVRIGLARQVRADRAQEKAFRVFIQELPDGAGLTGTQLQILLRVGVPVFVRPLEAARAQLGWSVERSGEDAWRLTVHNQGQLHERVSALTLQDAVAGAVLAQVDGFAYVLPGQTRSWEIQPPPGFPPARVRLSASGEDGPIHVDLPIPAP